MSSFTPIIGVPSIGIEANASGEASVPTSDTFLAVYTRSGVFMNSFILTGSIIFKFVSTFVGMNPRSWTL